MSDEFGSCVFACGHPGCRNAVTYTIRRGTRASYLLSTQQLSLSMPHTEIRLERKTQRKTSCAMRLWGVVRRHVPGEIHNSFHRIRMDLFGAFLSNPTSRSVVLGIRICLCLDTCRWIYRILLESSFFSTHAVVTTTQFQLASFHLFSLRLSWQRLLRCDRSVCSDALVRICYVFFLSFFW